MAMAGIALGVVPVLAPFPDIAVHVVEAEAVRFELTDRCGVRVTVLAFDPKRPGLERLPGCCICGVACR